MIWLNYLVDAVALGSLYALVTLGMALLFGLMGLVNFAHGELIMTGGYVFYLVLGMAHESLAVAVVAALCAVVVLAIIMERLAFRPLRDANPMILLISSFALSYLLQNAALAGFGARAKTFSVPSFFGNSMAAGSIRLPMVDVVEIGLAVVLLVGLTLFLNRTSFGIRMLAAASDFKMARLLGVRANRVIAGAFAISGVLATAVSFALIVQSGTASFDMGSSPVLIAFAATIIGGLGSLTGAALGGFLLGGLTILLDATLPSGVSSFRDAFLYLIVIAFLMVRPQGLRPAASARERT
jgi:branched-chain amino acid transport system permease protein